MRQGASGDNLKPAFGEVKEDIALLALFNGAERIDSIRPCSGRPIQHQGEVFAVGGKGGNTTAFPRPFKRLRLCRAGLEAALSP